MLQFVDKLRKKSDIYRFMCIHGDTLLSNKHFKSEILLRHSDGSEFNLLNCSWEQCEEKIYIWTEHCGYFYFYKGDIDRMDIRIYEWNEEAEDMELTKHTIINFNMEVMPNDKDETGFHN